MNYEKLKQIIEASLFAAGQPMTVEKIQKLFEENEQPSKDDVRCALEEIQADYKDRAIELKEVASGFRFQVIQGLSPWVSRLWDEKPAKYSRALMETLALIAYRQPITRSEIEEIRGVSVSTHIVKTLQEREWVRVVGHRDVPGRPALYATTKNFLDYFDLKSLEELPPLSELKDIDAYGSEFDEEEIAAAAVHIQAANEETVEGEPEEAIAEDIDSEDVKLEAEDAVHAAEELEDKVEAALAEIQNATADIEEELADVIDPQAVSEPEEVTSDSNKEETEAEPT